MTAQFHITPADPALVSLVQQHFGLPHFVARTLVAHGIKSVEEAELFLNPDLERDWLNPYEIPNMEAAVDRLERALRNGEHVLVFGDFDLDGISATTVLTRGLRELGGVATPLIPKRFEEGYGLTEPAINRAEACLAKVHNPRTCRAEMRKPDLIVTVDCGISCKEEAKDVLARGIDLVVTDHHEPGASVPEGIVVTDPKMEETCQSSILAGVGVALKVVCALGARFGKPNLWRDYTDFATLGTVADLMPLTGENRALVADGISKMNDKPRACIAALVGVCNIAGKELSSTNLSFSLIPRLNAAGRMGNADLALELLMTDDFEIAQQKAQELNQVNEERRSIEKQLAEEAEGIAESTYDGQRALVVAHEGWHEGVKGIVASRLVGKYGVPALLFTIDGDQARGSGRSVGNVNLFKAVESTQDLLTRFGGHEAAVGVTLPVENLPEFAQRLCAYMDALPEGDFHPLVEIDAVVDLAELTRENVESLGALAPFGQENLTPRFLAHNVRLEGQHAVGMDKNHLSCALTDGLATVDGIMFHVGEGMGALLECGGVVDAAFQVQIDEWRGRRTVKCMLSAIEPACPCPAMHDLMKRFLDPDDLVFIETFCNEDLSSSQPTAQAEDSAKDFRQQWSAIAQRGSEELTRHLTQKLIGTAQLHSAQQQALDALARGRNTLAVMGTGRGKSLIFQIHAARTALLQGKASLFVYPLRALISDQHFHMDSFFGSLGLKVAALTGESSLDERVTVYAGLADGSIDAVLTTPEYLAFHAEDIALCGRIGFVAIDEAHHMQQAGAGKRSAYAALSDVQAMLGNPVVLAVTATLPQDVHDSVRSLLRIDVLVTDDASRQNLQVDDRRNIKDRDTYVASIIASGEKTIIYAPSRAATVSLARTLRAMVPQVALQIGFYNAGLARPERQRIERLFREDVLRVLVCTSAFGEGVNIPDVRHVVLYGMPFSDVEFNQVSGRAGRDGKHACIHMLYGKQDAQFNEGLLRQAAPLHDDMACVYRQLKIIQRMCANHDDRALEALGASVQTVVHQGDIFFTIAYEQLAQLCQAHSPLCKVNAAACASALMVFEELDLVRSFDDDATGAHYVHVHSVDSKVELMDSVAYREGTFDVQLCEEFSCWALDCSQQDLREKLIRPILPDAQ